MPPNRNSKLLRAAILLVFIALSIFFLWRWYLAPDPNAGLVYGNGRIEATEIDVAAKMAGRIQDILVREGDFVTAGQVVARMDTENLMAQLREAQALFHQAESSVAIANSQLVQREAEKQAALALVAQREAELNVARKRYERSSSLAGRGATSQQEADDDFARQQSAIAAVSASKAQVAASDAAIVTARAQMAGAESALLGAQASIDRIQADISDSELKAVRDGRVQYRIAQPGEVIAAGGRVLNLVDLRDVYMTFFLPTSSAGRLALGTEVRIIIDAAPNYVFPAKVSFVADVAQFTPKSVETASEREKLMFRVRAQIPQDLLDANILRVKTGLPGMAFILENAQGEWPEHMAVRIP
ncbi:MULTISPECIES: HlyD family efflux transporter periplasmic adaptor subunit [unclassified Methylophaga]|jgi:HlyD family secretion protein|uniref:HlyD family secretion protein n=2 Tax=Methylophaga TaxID=40222 RepID=UPI000C8C4A95|nr:MULTISPECIES: HlyD family efflux transporter periplasmic adaptor subunit [unclassified Methylophaga]MAK65648.1 glycoside hydrolase family 43 [Methylophaga sp.]MAY16371.1 glycoside hydrolase family 43 [Methylophaga sp.]MBN45129.1 glycoside hydrolase family 43 [Methylophaga sp.]|tara:strand:- start:53157 stop:54230 length:1074 start_codon:yes stop_codon:yes gene_type:complete